MARIILSFCAGVLLTDACWLIQSAEKHGGHALDLFLLVFLGAACLSVAIALEIEEGPKK